MISPGAKEARAALRSVADPRRAPTLHRFFKTGPGEYAEGDVFIGATVPQVRKLVGKFGDLPLSEVSKLLRSRIHEERLLALLILVRQYQCGDPGQRDRVFRCYIAHLKWINNWDLIDVTAGPIVGAHLSEHESRPLLKKWAGSENVWHRRIAIMSTFHFIKQNNFADTLHLAEVLLNDKHDLIHKAVGWMLREVGNRDRAAEEAFLKKHYQRMPRTMLRYAIEKFPEARRQAYLKGGVRSG